MNYLKIILITLSFSLTYVPSIHAQLLKKLKNKVEQAAEDAVANKAAEKASQEVEKQMDTLLNPDPNYESQSQEKLQKLLTQSDNSMIIIEDVYTFDTNVVYKMHMISDGKPASMDYSMWFTHDHNYMATKIENIENEESKNKETQMEMFTIIDEKNEAMIMLMESQKMAQVISMEKIKNLANSQVDKKNNEIVTPNIKKTGRTKKIIGYTCEEFSGQTEDGIISFWITHDINLYQKNMFLNMSKSLGGDQFQSFPDAAKGFLMETNFEDNTGKNKGDKTSMVVTKIDKKSLQISTKEYQKIDLGGFMKN